MSRMSREFTLVLLGSGILTAGYFAAPAPAEVVAQKADEQAVNRVGGTTHRSGYHGGIMPLLWLHSPGYSGSVNGRPVSSTAGVTRGGIGGIGRTTGVGA